MTLELNISASYATKAQDTSNVRLSDDQMDIAGLSLTEKQTFNLAREAETGDSAWDKAILNLVHPPALSLYALLDSGRTVVPPPLPQVQEAYSNVAKATHLADGQNGQDASEGTDVAKTSRSDVKNAPAVAVQSVSQTHAAPVSTATTPTASSSATQAIIA